jgi:hypothetical protein
MSKRHPAIPRIKSARVPETRKPQRPEKLRRMLEDDDSFEFPETALGGTKE